MFTIMRNFSHNTFEISVHQLSSDFAILVYGDNLFQLHSDATYSEHPLLGIIPENPPKGAGIEIWLYESDQCHLQALDYNEAILHPSLDKSYGLRECVILSNDENVWVPSRPLEDCL